MWMLVLFDMTVMRRDDRFEADRFKDFLQEEGFLSLQYAVYAKQVDSRSYDELKDRIRGLLPAKAHVDILYLTDLQFEGMTSFYGKMHRPVVNSSGQYDLF